MKGDWLVLNENPALGHFRKSSMFQLTLGKPGKDVLFGRGDTVGRAAGAAAAAGASTNRNEERDVEEKGSWCWKDNLFSCTVLSIHTTRLPIKSMHPPTLVAAWGLCPRGSILGARNGALALSLKGFESVVFTFN